MSEPSTRVWSETDSGGPAGLVIPKAAVRGLQWDVIDRGFVLNLSQEIFDGLAAAFLKHLLLPVNLGERGQRNEAHVCKIGNDELVLRPIERSHETKDSVSHNLHLLGRILLDDPDDKLSLIQDTLLVMQASLSDLWERRGNA